MGWEYPMDLSPSPKLIIRPCMEIVNNITRQKIPKDYL